MRLKLNVLLFKFDHFLCSTKWQREAWPGHHPYYSHRSIFDVFPSGAFSEEKGEI